jgi:hypothetical protein
MVWCSWGEFPCSCWGFIHILWFFMTYITPSCQVFPSSTYFYSLLLGGRACHGMPFPCGMISHLFRWNLDINHHPSGALTLLAYMLRDGLIYMLSDGLIYWLMRGHPFIYGFSLSLKAFHMCSSYIIWCLISWIHLLGTYFEEDIYHLSPFCTFPCFVWWYVSLEGLTLSIIRGLTSFIHLIPFIYCWSDISHWDQEVSWFYVLDHEGRWPLMDVSSTYVYAY